MDLNFLNFLPPWESLDMSGEEDEKWKTSELVDAGEALYKIWVELFGFVYAFAESLGGELPEDAPETHELTIKRMILENAMIVAPKIISSTKVNSYILQMENAATIRVNCRELMEQVTLAVMLGFGDPGYKEVIKEQLQEFKNQFKVWVNLFQKDDLEDEWGLFK